MRERWEQLAAREQILVVLGTLLAAIFLLATQIWDPLSDSRHQLLQNNRQSVAEITRVRQLLADIELLRENRITNPLAAGNASPEQEIEQAVANHNLRIDRLRPAQDGTIQLQLKDSSFAQIATLLQELEERRGFQVENISLRSAKRVGNVDLQLQVQK